MSVLTGGIFSKPRGKTGGIVFGAARTRQGKLATARELVPPSNPNTPAQQTQRGKFKSALDIVRRAGSEAYRSDWNRAVGQLPGFQSMLSTFLNQMNAAKDVILTYDVNLGILEHLFNLEVNTDDSGVIAIDWASDVHGNGKATDEVIVLAVAKEEAVREGGDGVNLITGFHRSDNAISLSQYSPGQEVNLYIWVKGSGDTQGMYSVAKHYLELVS